MAIASLFVCPYWGWAAEPILSGLPGTRLWHNITEPLPSLVTAMCHRMSPFLIFPLKLLEFPELPSLPEQIPLPRWQLPTMVKLHHLLRTTLSLQRQDQGWSKDGQDHTVTCVSMHSFYSLLQFFLCLNLKLGVRTPGSRCRDTGLICLFLFSH